MHVELTYFKDSGKYYSEGEVQVEARYFHEALEKVRELLESGNRPGLVDGYHFNVLANVYTDNGPLPFLFVRGQNLKGDPSDNQASL